MEQHPPTYQHTLVWHLSTKWWMKTRSGHKLLWLNAFPIIVQSTVYWATLPPPCSCSFCFFFSILRSFTLRSLAFPMPPALRMDSRRLARPSDGWTTSVGAPDTGPTHRHATTGIYRLKCACSDLILLLKVYDVQFDHLHTTNLNLVPERLQQEEEEVVVVEEEEEVVVVVELQRWQQLQQVREGEEVVAERWVEVVILE